MRLLLRRASRVFGPRREHNADVLALRGVVVAGEIEDLYKVQRWLGEGQTAVVLLGERLADGKRYALKRFRLNDGLRAASEGLRDEVQVLRALPDHGGLVGLREIVSTPGYIYLAMELVAGGDLLSPIEERGAYTERAAQSIFAQMVDAVDAMHQANIVHRDLKPENVCFTDGGRKKLKIIDLGAAGFLTERGLSGLCGTPLYAAPEVIPWYFCEQGSSSPPRYDERVDLWSMGVALYVMLSGSAPFNQDQPVGALLRDVCKGHIGARPARLPPSRAVQLPCDRQPGSNLGVTDAFQGVVTGDHPRCANTRHATQRAKTPVRACWHMPPQAWRRRTGGRSPIRLRLSLRDCSVSTLTTEWACRS
jgi:serine/threonine protein kinase